MRLQHAFGFAWVGHFFATMGLSWLGGFHFFDPNQRGDYLLTLGGIAFGFCFVFHEAEKTVKEDDTRVKMWLTTPSS